MFAVEVAPDKEVAERVALKDGLQYACPPRGIRDALIATFGQCHEALRFLCILTKHIEVGVRLADEIGLTVGLLVGIETNDVNAVITWVATQESGFIEAHHVG